MSEGLQALVDGYKASNARLAAKHLRAMASNYSIEYEWVRKMYEAAKEADLTAEFYERKIKEA